MSPSANSRLGVFEELVARGCVLAAFAFVCRPAAGFCPARTCRDVQCGPDSQSDCQERRCARDERGCVSEGELAYYALPCASFGVDGASASRVGLPPEQFQWAVERAFARWTSVECSGRGAPGLGVASAGVVRSDGNRFCATSPEHNLGVWTIPASWTHAPNQAGLTTLWTAPDGRVLDADVELNSNSLLEQDGDPADALLTLAMHEAGHVLGLDHSDDPDALMAASYASRSLFSRNLSQDDVNAICTLYPPSRTPLRCPSPMLSDEALDSKACARAGVAESGCALSSARPRPHVALGAALLVALGLTVRRRRGA